MSKLMESIDVALSKIDEEVNVETIHDIQAEIYEMLSLGKNDGQNKEENVQATYEEIFNTYTTEELANETFKDEAELRDYIETKANEIYEIDEEVVNEDHQLYYDDIQEMSTEERHELWLQNHEEDFEDSEEGNSKFWDWEEEFPVKELNENVGDTKDYSGQIEKLFRKWFKDNAELGIRIIQWATSSYDLNIQMREVGEGETRKYQYRVSNWSPLVEVEDWADEIGEYIADHIPALEYKGAKVLDKARDNGEDYEQTIWYFDQQIGIKDFGDHIFDSEKLNEDAENILSDEDEAEINSIINAIRDLNGTIKHVVVDEVISINARIEELNKKLKYSVEEIEDETVYLNTADVISDLEYLIKESDWAKEDAEEEMNESEESEIDKVEKRIEEIKKHLDYCDQRDEVCLAIDGEQERAELEAELAELEAKLDDLEMNESDELVEEVMQPGDKYVNEVGAVIVITDPTNDGRPQWNIAPSQEEYDAGKYTCLSTDSYESLERILTANTYKKVETIAESEAKDYSDLETKIADEILEAMLRKGLDSTNIVEVSEYLVTDFTSQEIINYMDETGEELMWYIEEDPNTTFKVVVTTV